MPPCDRTDDNSTTSVGGLQPNGSVALNTTGDVVTVTFADDVATASVALKVLKAVEDATGQTLAADYTQTFTLATDQPSGGYVSGAIYDATNGRPRPGLNGVTLVGSTWE